jgi:hypothetical protein
MLSLFDGTHTNPRKVTFTIWNVFAKGFALPVLLSGVSREDGSGESWNFTGCYEKNSVRGYFSTKTRKGFLELSRRE